MSETDDAQNAKMLALLGYAGFFVGFPLGIVPLVMAKDELSLFHGKVSTAVWLAVFAASTVLGVVVSAFATITCGFGAIIFPVIFIPLLWGAVVGIHGIVLATNEEMTEPIGGFGLGEMLFSSVKVKDALPADAPRPAAAEPAPTPQDAPAPDAAPAEPPPAPEAPAAPPAASEAAGAPPPAPAPTEAPPPTPAEAVPPPPPTGVAAPAVPPPPPAAPADAGPPPPPPPKDEGSG